MACLFQNSSSFFLQRLTEQGNSPDKTGCLLGKPRSWRYDVLCLRWSDCLLWECIVCDLNVDNMTLVNKGKYSFLFRIQYLIKSLHMYRQVQNNLMWTCSKSCRSSRLNTAHQEGKLQNWVALHSVSRVLLCSRQSSFNKCLCISRSPQNLHQLKVSQF